MWIVAIGWSYVVILMAATETSFVAGVMTFLVYCMIPVSILFYLTGGKRRRARREAKAAGIEAPGLFSLPQHGVAKNKQTADGGGSFPACDGADGGCGGGGD